MKKWEDIIKERLEEYDCTPPEGSLEAFHQLREAKSAFPGKKGIPWGWLLVPATVAASLFIFLFNNVTPTANVNPELSPLAVTDQRDTIPCDMPIAIAPVSEEVQPRPRPTVCRTNETIFITPEHTDEGRDNSTIDTSDSTESHSPAFAENNEQLSTPLYSDASSPSKSEQRDGSWPAIIKALPSTLAFSTIPFLASGIFKPVAFTSPTPPSLYSTNPTAIAPTSARHAFPLKIGLTTAFCINERVRLSTGIQYSQYRSVFTYDDFGDIKQVVHYLGVPLRADWSVFSDKWFEIYLGSGFELDQCVKATFSDTSVKKDGLVFSLTGVGGVQLNLCKNFGLYIQPELVWDITFGNRKLITYRTEHPLMFDVSAGLRIVF